MMVIGAVSISSCGGSVEPSPSASEGGRILQTDREWLIRTSLALRGLRPSVADMALLDADPSQAAALVDAYLHSPDFLEVVKDLHGDLLLIRNDSVPQFPALGPLYGHDLFDIYSGITSEPLDLIAAVVDADRPYTDIVTSKTTYTNDVGALIWGFPYDFDVGGVQETTWPDGRPLAGILSSSKIWQRYESAGSNFHRGRANVIADKLLCEAFDTREIVVEGGIDIADEEAVASAVLTDPACVSCHQALDPLSGYLWGYKPVLRQNQIGHAYTQDCDDDYHDVTLPDLGPNFRTSDYCYPLRFYNPAEEGQWETWGLRPPAFYGQAVEDMADVGELIADDPRFSRCAVKNFFAYFNNIERDLVPEDITTQLQTTFETSNFSIRELVRSIVMSPEFRAKGTNDEPTPDPLARIRTIRPEQYANVVEDLTGFTWMAVGDPWDCETFDDRGTFGTQCWGPVDLGRSDRFGYHSMSGGTDSFWIVRPTHEPSPIKALTMERFAWNAAGFVVDTDFALPAAERWLLHGVEAATEDEPTVRAQLAALQLRILGESASPNDAVIDEMYALFLGARATLDVPSSWKLVIAALLQDPGMVFN